MKRRCLIAVLAVSVWLLPFAESHGQEDSLIRVFRRLIDQVRIEIQLPIGEHTLSWGPCGEDEAELYSVWARQATNRKTGNVVHRALSVTIECIWFDNGEPRRGGAAIYDSAKLRRFEVDPVSHEVFVKFVESRGYHPYTLKRFPVWAVTLIPTGETDPIPHSLTNECGGITLRDYDYSYSARAEGILFGRDIADGTAAQNVRIDRWRSTAFCLD